jgi:carbon-monoxide dehydrogenase medium subunit
VRDTDFARPGDPAEAEALRAATGGDYLAGGTALQLGWATRRAPGVLIDLGGIDFGAPVTRAGDALRLSADATLETLRRDPLLGAALPALAGLIDRMAGLGTRTLATLGGNVAWRAGDLVPPLLALDAEVEGAGGARTPLAAWLAGPPSLIVALHAPIRPLACEKVGRREAFSPAVVTVAVSGTRAAIGGGPVPPQCVTDPDTLDLPSDVAASGAHRRAVARNLIRYLSA